MGLRRGGRDERARRHHGRPHLLPERGVALPATHAEGRRVRVVAGSPAAASGRSGRAPVSAGDGQPARRGGGAVGGATGTGVRLRNGNVTGSIRLGSSLDTHRGARRRARRSNRRGACKRGRRAPVAAVPPMRTGSRPGFLSPLMSCERTASAWAWTRTIRSAGGIRSGGVDDGGCRAWRRAWLNGIEGDVIAAEAVSSATGHPGGL